MRNFLNMLIVAISAFLIVGCESVPFTGRNQLMLTSQSEEAQLGEQAWKEVLSQNRVSGNSTYNIALKRVGANLAKAANKSDYKWEFLVFENTEPNAFCLPGGKVGVYSGLFQYTANDAELSSVVGHEIGHAIARHGGERMSHGTIQEIGAQAVATTLNSKSAGTIQAAMVAYSAGTNLGVMLPYSRTHEYEADKLGLVYMAKAGYNPNAAITFWQKFGQLSQTGTVGEFFSTHPMSEKRIGEMKAYLPTALDMYNTAPNKKNLGESLK
jgi:predicted Zn-dependent protease